MKNIVTYLIISLLPLSAAAQYVFDFEVRDVNNELSDHPVYVTQLEQYTDSQKFCLAQNQIKNPTSNYRVDRPILAISYVTNGTCTTQLMRKRDFETSPRKMTIYPERPAELRSIDFRLFDTNNRPITNELFFFETDDPNQKNHPNPNHFDGHHLRTKIFKRYLIIVFRIDEQQTGQFTVDCKTDMRGNLLVNSVFSTRCNTPDCLSPRQANQNYNFLRRI
jgi:hypothetical protein